MAYQEFDLKRGEAVSIEGIGTVVVAKFEGDRAVKLGFAMPRSVKVTRKELGPRSQREHGPTLPPSAPQG